MPHWRDSRIKPITLGTDDDDYDDDDENDDGSHMCVASQCPQAETKACTLFHSESHEPITQLPTMNVYANEPYIQTSFEAAPNTTTRLVIF